MASRKCKSVIFHFIRKVFVERAKLLPFLPSVREKPNFLHVRKKSGNFEKMSENFGHLSHVRESSGNFVMLCQGILTEFYYDIFLRLKLPSYDKGSTWVVFM